MGPHEAVLISEDESLFVPKLGGSVYTQFLGTLDAGTRLVAIDGERLLHATAGGKFEGEVYYQLTATKKGQEHLRGRYFRQSMVGFSNAVGVGGVAGDVIRRTAATQAVIKNFLDVYLGALACAGGPLAWSITGMNVLVTTGQVIRDYRTYEDALVAILSCRKELKEHLRTLYDEVFYTLLIGTIEQKLKSKGKEALADAVKGPKLAGKLVGVLLGAVGEDRMKERFKAVKELCTKVFVKVAQHSMEKGRGLGTVTISEEQADLLAKHHILPIFNETSLGNMPLSVGAQIAREVSAWWNMKSTYVKVAAALEKLG
jgi:hypothetical protein